ncbi:MAG: hypothetical protein ILNGONEN_02002 [Syntrophorhabdaceae bacterium]|nr:hypothetical protein [Syntrophorhabdaceae bacterium]
MPKKTRTLAQPATAVNFSRLGKIDFTKIDPKEAFRKRRTFFPRSLQSVYAANDPIFTKDEILSFEQKKITDAIKQFKDNSPAALSDNKLNKGNFDNILKGKLEGSNQKKLSKGGEGKELLSDLANAMRLNKIAPNTTPKITK